ncbi:MAG: hypothetical protein MUF25_28260, partial [Pirellulaceae bacterium]|nr:hypothetical protein [Pirellulaceae bacterium]
ITVTDDGLDTLPPGITLWTPQGAGPATNGQTENVRRQAGGPIVDDVVGAIHTVLAHPTNPNILYAGGTNSGVWRTTNALLPQPTWEPLTDDMPGQSIGALVFDLADATRQTLWAGIGLYSAYGRVGSARAGLLQTTDGGNNWTVVDGGGVLSGKNVSGIVARGNNVVVSVNTADAFTMANIGIFRSTDGGATFTRMSVGDGTGATGLPEGVSYDLANDPINTNTMYTSIAFNADPARNGVYKSTNGGATWTKVSNAAIDALIGSGTSNLEIAVGRSNNVYVAVVNTGVLAGIFRSGDGGATWTQMDTPVTNEGGTNVGLNPGGGKGPAPGSPPEQIAGGQGAIHFSIVADPSNPNLVYVGGDRQPLEFQNPTSIGANDYSGRLFRGDASQPAGNQWYHLTHSNALGIAGGGTANSSAPHADSRDMTFDASGNLIEVDDGGIYRRTSPRTNTGDWYSLINNLQAGEMHDIAYDPISNILISGNQDTGTQQQNSPGSFEWYSVSTADGGDVAVSVNPLNPTQSVRYSSFQNLGGFRRSVYDAANNLISTAFPALTGFLGDGQFNTPVEINAVDPLRLAIGGAQRVYESLDQGDNVSVVGSFGVNSFDGDPIAYGGRLLGVNNPDVLYVGSGNRVYVRTLAGGPLSVSGYTGGAPRDIVLDSDAWTTAYVVDATRVWVTSNAGATWTNITGNLNTLDTDFHSIVYAAGLTSDAIYVGGRTGVVPVWDLDVSVADNVLVAGTFGRGAWTASASGAGGGLDVVLTVNTPRVLSEDGISGPDTGTTGTVRRTGSTSGALAVTIVFDATEVTINGDASGLVTVIIPDGAATSAPFTITAVLDSETDGIQTVFLTPDALGYNGVPGVVDVLDAAADSNATITATVFTDSISESFGFASLQIARTDNLGAATVTIASSDPTEAVPSVATTTLVGGQVSTFTSLRGVDDNLLDGTRTAIIRITGTGATRSYAPVGDVVDVLDNEPWLLTVAVGDPLTLDTVPENAGRGALRGMVRIPAPMEENLVVRLISSDTSEARVPASVTILAGLTWAEFEIDTVDELGTDAPRTVTITALADQFTSGSDTLIVEPVENAEGYARSGDQNRHRDQGQIVIDSNVITSSSQAGIRVAAGDRTVQFNGVTTSDMPHPGTVINFANRNTQNLAPGV